MSCTSLLHIPESGGYSVLRQFHNSWLFAPRVWDTLSKKYFGPNYCWLTQCAEDKTFWRLVDDPRLEPCERLTLASTYDRCICERDKARELARMLRVFDFLYPVRAEVNRIVEMADALEEHAERPGVGFGWIQTSVTDDVWDLPVECDHPMHNTASDEPCPVCGGQWDDRDVGRRRFDWSIDAAADRHFLLFATYGDGDRR